MRLCACGCGEALPEPVRARDRHHRFLHGHNTRRSLDLPKVCSGCKQEKAPEAFHISTNVVAGKSYARLSSRCKDCSRVAGREWARRNPEAGRRWRVENPERMAELREAWVARDPERARVLKVKRQQARRARKCDAFIEDVDPRVVYEMHGGRCGICEEFIDLKVEDMHVDHVIPLSRGGMHGYVNTQPAHSKCNLRKGAKVGGSDF